MVSLTNGKPQAYSLLQKLLLVWILPTVFCEFGIFHFDRSL